MIDGMVVREMLRRCCWDKETYGRCLDLYMNGYHGQVKQDQKNEETLRLLITHYKYSGFFSARILDHVNQNTFWILEAEGVLPQFKALMESMPENPFSILTNHDCFRCHPNYGNDLRKQYNQILSELAKSDILSFIVSQILDSKHTVNKIGDLSAAILETNYSLS